MTSYDVASTIHQAQVDSTRHIIKRILKPYFSSYVASYDVASTIHQSLAGGAPLPPPSTRAQ